MGEKTFIEWCDSTVNPSPCCTGCELFPKNCYAYAMHRRYDGVNAGWPKSFTEPTLFLDRIKTAARWSDLRGTKRPKKPWLDGMPRLIFVDDLGDPFAPFDAVAWDIKSHWLRSALPVMAAAPHVWLLLTKWPNRLSAFTRVNGAMPDNVWCGTSVTIQAHDCRIVALLECRASVRFLSLEPLLASVKLKSYLHSEFRPWMSRRDQQHGPKLNWVIVGGESGPGARPMHPDWARSIRDQCQAAGVPFFLKQMHIDGWVSKDMTEWPKDLRVRELPNG